MLRTLSTMTLSKHQRQNLLQHLWKCRVESAMQQQQQQQQPEEMWRLGERRERREKGERREGREGSESKEHKLKQSKQKQEDEVIALLLEGCLSPEVEQELDVQLYHQYIVYKRKMSLLKEIENEQKLETAQRKEEMKVKVLNPLSTPQSIRRAAASSSPSSPCCNGVNMNKKCTKLVNDPPGKEEGLFSTSKQLSSSLHSLSSLSSFSLSDTTSSLTNSKFYSSSPSSSSQRKHTNPFLGVACDGISSTSLPISCHLLEFCLQNDLPFPLPSAPPPLPTLVGSTSSDSESFDEMKEFTFSSEQQHSQRLESESSVVPLQSSSFLNSSLSSTASSLSSVFTSPHDTISLYPHSLPSSIAHTSHHPSTSTNAFCTRYAVSAKVSPLLSSSRTSQNPLRKQFHTVIVSATDFAQLYPNHFAPGSSISTSTPLMLSMLKSYQFLNPHSDQLNASIDESYRGVPAPLPLPPLIAGPLSPSFCLTHFPQHLTWFERWEIMKYKKIYYFGPLKSLKYVPSLLVSPEESEETEESKEKKENEHKKRKASTANNKTASPEKPCSKSLRKPVDEKQENRNTKQDAPIEQEDELAHPQSQSEYTSYYSEVSETDDESSQNSQQQQQQQEKEKEEDRPRPDAEETLAELAKDKDGLYSTAYSYDDTKGDFYVAMRDQIAYRFEVVESLGHGSFGHVYRVNDHKQGCECALKIIRNRERLAKQSLVEIRILEYLRAEDPDDKYHVLQIADYFMFRDHLCLTFDLMSMNLYQFQRKCGFRPMSMQLVRHLSVQILETLCFLRSRRIVHCDLKPENIVIERAGSARLRVADFGSSFYEQEPLYSYVQSRYYRAPEVVMGMRFGCPIDMWSFGCVLYELAAGAPLFPADDDADLFVWMCHVLGKPPADLFASAKKYRQFFDEERNVIVQPDKKGKVKSVGGTSIKKELNKSDWNGEKEEINLIVGPDGVCMMIPPTQPLPKLERQFASEKDNENETKEEHSQRKPNVSDETAESNETSTLSAVSELQESTERMAPSEGHAAERNEEKEFLIDFISNCLKWNEKERMTPQMAMLHPWITGKEHQANPVSSLPQMANHSSTHSNITEIDLSSLSINTTAVSDKSSGHNSPSSSSSSSVPSSSNTSVNPTTLHFPPNLDWNDTNNHDNTQEKQAANDLSSVMNFHSAAFPSSSPSASLANSLNPQPTSSKRTNNHSSQMSSFPQQPSPVFELEYSPECNHLQDPQNLQNSPCNEHSPSQHRRHRPSSFHHSRVKYLLGLSNCLYSRTAPFPNLVEIFRKQQVQMRNGKLACLSETRKDKKNRAIGKHPLSTPAELLAPTGKRMSSLKSDSLDSDSESELDEGKETEEDEEEEEEEHNNRDGEGCGNENEKRVNNSIYYAKDGILMIAPKKYIEKKICSSLSSAESQSKMGATTDSVISFSAAQLEESPKQHAKSFNAKNSDQPHKLYASGEESNSVQNSDASCSSQADENWAEHADASGLSSSSQTNPDSHPSLPVPSTPAISPLPSQSPLIQLYSLPSVQSHPPLMFRASNHALRLPRRFIPSSVSQLSSLSLSQCAASSSSAAAAASAASASFSSSSANLRSAGLISPFFAASSVVLPRLAVGACELNYRSKSGYVRDKSHIPSLSTKSCEKNKDIQKTDSLNLPDGKSQPASDLAFALCPLFLLKG
eukprot:MONOS_5939.1-p1 / transcript=MONOS_5939.1 / gene=MONOS_5939 / organism=Monocercomonoides_exilis_PA203 / gene_product=kinase-like protein / transcript_product=kinase-like protein / location=Mono_scaffold00179:71123-76385(+) / protein_length=1670 / sequence_SO=supercontig / SO=protein_coding / is_pseudo=false